MGIDGKEKADLLAKRGTLEPQDNKPLSPESLKKHIFENLVDILKSEQFCPKPRKQAVANFRLQTGYYFMAHYLNKIGILPSSMCQL
ncbi:uncharacterized protein LOC103523915 [Trichonephila clavipes]|nr:uncharacterized protein LOC103523915 [Trichonephila clavipes]